jgi:hypothetical protein
MRDADDRAVLPVGPLERLERLQGAVTQLAAGKGGWEDL